MQGFSRTRTDATNGRASPKRGKLTLRMASWCSSCSHRRRHSSSRHSSKMPLHGCPTGARACRCSSTPAARESERMKLVDAGPGLTRSRWSHPSRGHRGLVDTGARTAVHEARRRVASWRGDCPWSSRARRRRRHASRSASSASRMPRSDGCATIEHRVLRPFLYQFGTTYQHDAGHAGHARTVQCVRFDTVRQARTSSGPDEPTRA